jgi:hypothetical protein
MAEFNQSEFNASEFNETGGTQAGGGGGGAIVFMGTAVSLFGAGIGGGTW